jgi:hypothetical protein
MIFLRILFFVFFDDAFLLELHYKAIAHQLTNLGESYIHVLHQLGPFSASLFRWVYGAWGEHLMVARSLAFVLCFIQVVTVSSGINSVNGLREFNLFTGVIHVVLLHLFQDFIILTPLLIAMTFICFVYTIMLRILRGDADNQLFLLAGILLSIAGCFLFPILLFAVPTFLTVVIYSRFDTRSIGLFLVGLFLPIGILFSYYFFQNYGLEYIKINFYFGLSLRFLSQLPFTVYLVVGFMPLVLFILSFFKILAMYNMINYQQKMIVCSIFYLLTGVIIFVLLPEKTISYFMLLIPFLIHFFGILFIETKYIYTTKLAMTSFAIMLSIPFLDKINGIDKYLYYSSLNPKQVISEYGKVLNLSEDKNVLFNNQYATGFCEYMIAKPYFEDTSPESAITIFNKFEEDMPDAIYDPTNLVQAKFSQIPSLSRKYHYMPSFKIYKRIE